MASIKKEVSFSAYQLPTMKSGVYDIEVSQRMEIDHVDQSGMPQNLSRKVAVAGDRFNINPDLIHTVFPPAGSLGEHSNVLPHIVFNKSTLPWEWSAFPKGQSPNADQRTSPWLALIVLEDNESPGGIITKADFIKKFSEQGLWDDLLAKNWVSSNSTGTFTICSPSFRAKPGDLDPKYAKIQDKVNHHLSSFQEVKQLKAKDLASNATGNIKWKNASDTTNKLFPFEDPKEDLQVIDIERKLLEAILPIGESPRFLSHVRQPLIEIDGATLADGDEKSVVISNRLPTLNGKSTAYLVSVQGRYTISGGKVAFDYQGAKDHDLIRLVVLTSWNFSCISKKHDFRGLLTGLNNYVVPAGQADGTPPAGDTFSNTLRLHNTKNNATIEPYLAQGAVPLLHNMREGNRSISWYHGPMTTGKHVQPLPRTSLNNTNLVPNADSLLRYDSTQKMMDVSYAAAWELGRMLLLQEKDLSVKLFHWKRSHLNQLRAAEQAAVYDHIPFQNDKTLDFPDALRIWFRELRQLKHIPLQYLLPDEKLIPEDALRFFQVDETWMEALIDGAFSIGRVPYKMGSFNQDVDTAKAVSGFLLRSEVVSGWKDLLFEGYDTKASGETIDESTKLNVVRQDYINENLMLVMFDGVVKTLDIHLKPEALHFGFRAGTGDPVTYTKLLRDPQTGKAGSGQGSLITLNTWQDPSRRVVNIEGFKNVMGPSLNPGQFGMMMTEGVPKVRFLVKN